MKKVSYILIISILFTYLTFDAFAAVTEVLIKDVPVIAQGKNELPNGCEPTALTMLLNYYGVDVTKFEVAQSLPQGPAPYWKNGKLYAADPQKEFVGNPALQDSYGIYYKPILKAIESYLPDRSIDLSGKNFEDLLTYIDNGQPVMVWATISDAKGVLFPVINTTIWYFEDGTKFQWKGNEHALVLVGYTSDRKTVILNDSWNGKQMRYDYETFKNRWIGMGKQAVAIEKEVIDYAFKDVNSKHWYYEPVKKCKELSLINGYSDGTFQPKKNISAAEFITLVMKTVDIPITPDGSGYWASPYINLATDLEIIHPGQFTDFDAYISRQDCFSILYRVVQNNEVLKSVDQLSAEEYADFSAQFENIDRIRNLDLALYLNKFISGYDVNGHIDFKIDQNITRSEASVLILRIIDSSFRVK